MRMSPCILGGEFRFSAVCRLPWYWFLPSIVFFGHLALSAPDPRYEWIQVRSPVVFNLHTIRMFSADHGYAAGSSLLEYRQGEWRIAPHQPPVLIDRFFALGPSSLWVTNYTAYYESNLFQYDGTAWKGISHPLANNITGISFDRKGVGWIIGIGEVARRDGGAWVPLVPPTRRLLSRLRVEPNGTTWVIAEGRKLFRWDGTRWKPQLPEERTSAVEFLGPGMVYALAETSMHIYDGTRWRIHSSEKRLRGVVAFDLTAKDQIWAVGSGGLILHYNGERWDSVPSPTAEHLSAIHMLSATEGWIVGEKGTILRYALGGIGAAKSKRPGFKQRRIPSEAKVVDDEYGVALGDIDGNGRLDIYAVGIFEPNRLYVNYENGFREEAGLRGVQGLLTDARGAPPAGLDLGVVFADVDNDDDLDLYVCRLNNVNNLYLNNGNGFFRFSPSLGAGGGAPTDRSNVGVFGDVDNDGDLDLFVTNEESSNRLFLNDGNGAFTDATEHAGLRTTGGSMGAAFADIDNDGDLDLYVAHWSASNHLYQNNSSPAQGVRFTDVTESAGVGGDPFSKSNAVVFADVDNDGDLDLFVTNRKTSNRLFVNDGHGTFSDVTGFALGFDTLQSYGATFGDFDQDGWLDLYIANIGHNVLYRNRGNGTFQDVTVEFNAVLEGYSTGVATGDLDNDGDLDLYCANFLGASSMYYENILNDSTSIIIDLEGTRSNRDAVGARVSLYAGGHAADPRHLLGMREISGGSGYGSQNGLPAHFAASHGTTYDVVVFYPATGIRVVRSGIPAGTKLNIREEEGMARRRTLTGNVIRRAIIDREFQREAWKLAILFLFFGVSFSWSGKRFQWSAWFRLGVLTILFFFYAVQIAFLVHDHFLFSTLLPLASTLTLLLLVHLWYDRFVVRKSMEEEKIRIKDRIARDLHDDLASTLGSTSLYVESLKRSLTSASSDTMENVKKIDDLLTEAGKSMSDIVWSVRSEETSYKDLSARMRRLTSEVCKANRMRYEFRVTGDERLGRLEDEVRRNVYLILKEALNNIVKHAGATRVDVVFEISDHAMHLSISDDGQGFQARDALSQNGETSGENGGLIGHGLRNLDVRARAIGGNLTIDSTPGGGTRVHLSKKMM